MRALVVDATASGRGERKATRDAIGAGARAVSGVLERNGLEARIAEVKRVLFDGELLDSYNILLLSGMTTDIPAIRVVTKRWRRRGPAILGGPVASDPERALAKTCCDVAVVGEGEQTLEELLRMGLRDGALPRPEDLKSVRGIAYLDEGEPVLNQLRPFMRRREYDEYRPSTKTVRDYSLFYAARIYVEVLRGCSNYQRARIGYIGGACDGCGTCSKGGLEERYYCPKGIPPGCGYCSVPSLFGPPRSRSVEHIVDEVEALLREGVKRIVLSAPGFLDYGRDLLVEPDPLTDPRRPEPNYEELERLLSRLTELPGVAEGLASIMVENLKASLVTKRAAALLGKYLPGTAVSIGFETGSEKHSGLLGRPSTPTETLTAIERLRKGGLSPYAYFIHGLPGQSAETVDETVRAIARSREAGAERVIIYRFQSLPMSTFCGEPSGAPYVKDALSRRIHDAARTANLETKGGLAGKRLRVVIAEPYERDRKYFVAYPMLHGPVALVEGDFRKGDVIDVNVTGIASERMVYAAPAGR
jgi:radical SAM superfamily enzyme YgiQ (UPF0313 family)